jgi:hypothetical protein
MYYNLIFKINVKPNKKNPKNHLLKIIKVIHIYRMNFENIQKFQYSFLCLHLFPFLNNWILESLGKTTPEVRGVAMAQSRGSSYPILLESF